MKLFGSIKVNHGQVPEFDLTSLDPLAVVDHFGIVAENDGTRPAPRRGTLGPCPRHSK
jgi:hypothetical protein